MTSRTIALNLDEATVSREEVLLLSRFAKIDHDAGQEVIPISQIRLYFQRSSYDRFTALDLIQKAIERNLKEKGLSLATPLSWDMLEYDTYEDQSALIIVLLLAIPTALLSLVALPFIKPFYALNRRAKIIVQ